MMRKLSWLSVIAMLLYSSLSHADNNSPALQLQAQVSGFNDGSQGGFGETRGLFDVLSSTSQTIVMDNWTVWCWTSLGTVNVSTMVRYQEVCLLACRTTPGCAFISMDKNLKICWLISKDAECTPSRNGAYALIGDSQKRFDRRELWEFYMNDIMFNGNKALEPTQVGNNKLTCMNLCHIMPKCNVAVVNAGNCFIKNVPLATVPGNAAKDPSQNYTSFVMSNG